MIETERLLLRKPEPEDADALLRQVGDAEVMRYIANGETGSRDDAVAQVMRMMRMWDEDGFGRFIVVRRDSGDAIGRVGLLVWNAATWQNGTRHEFGEDVSELELGWTLERDAWGHGFATEAARAARDWALREVRPRRLISLIHPENVQSIGVARKLGEQHERDVVVRGVATQLWALPSSA